MGKLWLKFLNEVNFEGGLMSNLCTWIHSKIMLTTQINTQKCVTLHKISRKNKTANIYADGLG